MCVEFLLPRSSLHIVWLFFYFCPKVLEELGWLQIVLRSLEGSEGAVALLVQALCVRAALPNRVDPMAALGKRDMPLLKSKHIV